MKLKWREIRMQLGVPKVGTSPQIQQEAGINRDRTLRPKKVKAKSCATAAPPATDVGGEAS